MPIFLSPRIFPKLDRVVIRYHLHKSEGRRMHDKMGLVELDCKISCLKKFPGGVRCQCKVGRVPVVKAVVVQAPGRAERVSACPFRL